MILGVSNHFSERIWGFSIKSYDSNSFPLTELKIRKSDCLICHSSKPVHCHPQSELCPEQSRRAVCLRLLRCFDPGAATCPPSPPAERGADRPLCWQLQPQEISPPPTANLDRSSDRVYEHVTGLVKAVIEMSSKIQPAPPEEYVPMVKVSRPRRAPAARVPSPGRPQGPAVGPGAPAGPCEGSVVTACRHRRSHTSPWPRRPRGGPVLSGRVSDASCSSTRPRVSEASGGIAVRVKLKDAPASPMRPGGADAAGALACTGVRALLSQEAPEEKGRALGRRPEPPGCAPPPASVPRPAPGLVA